MMNTDKTKQTTKALSSLRNTKKILVNLSGLSVLVVKTFYYKALFKLRNSLFLVRYSLFISCFVFCVNYSFSQNATIDSLNAALNAATHDTTRAATLVALTEELIPSNPDVVFFE